MMRARCSMPPYKASALLICPSSTPSPICRAVNLCGSWRIGARPFQAIISTIPAVANRRRPSQCSSTQFDIAVALLSNAQARMRPKERRDTGWTDLLRSRLDAIIGIIVHSGKWSCRAFRLILRETVEKSFKRRIRLRRRLLLHPVTGARNDNRTAEIGAGGTGIGIKVGAGNETADDIALACNEEGRLADRLSLDIREICWVEALGAIAVQRSSKTAAAEGISIDGEVGGAHPGRAWLRVHHALKECRVGRLVRDPGIERGFARRSEINLAKRCRNVRLQLGLCDTFRLEVG